MREPHLCCLISLNSWALFIPTKCFLIFCVDSGMQPLAPKYSKKLKRPFNNLVPGVICMADISTKMNVRDNILQKQVTLFFRVTCKRLCAFPSVSKKIKWNTKHKLYVTFENFKRFYDKIGSCRNNCHYSVCCSDEYPYLCFNTFWLTPDLFTSYICHRLYFNFILFVLQ